MTNPTNNDQQHSSVQRRPFPPSQNVAQRTTQRSAQGATHGSVQNPAQGTPHSSAQGHPIRSNEVVAAKGANTNKRTVLVVVGVIVIALAIWLLVWLFACNGPSMFDANAQSGQAPYKTEAEMQEELDRVVQEGMFNISISSVIQFADGTSEGTAYIENVPGNRYNMKVTITDDDSGEVLYESGVLKPNQFIENIALAKDLDAGTYSATATFTALDQETNEEIGEAAAKVTLNVLA